MAKFLFKARMVFGWARRQCRFPGRQLYYLKKQLHTFRQSKRMRAPAEPERAIRWGYMRPTRVGLTEAAAERWVCARNGWNLDLFTGRAPANDNGGSGAYRLTHPQGLLRRSAGIQVIRVTNWGRFGNSIRQLTNAFRVAERLGSEFLHLDPHPFLKGERSGPFLIDWSATRGSQLALEGGFYFLDTFGICGGEPRDIGAVLTNLVRPMLAKSICMPDPRVRASDAVLHFRGGDVFGGNPHPAYGQPPASFYLGALEREDPARIWLISEDGLNPCLHAVASAAHKGNIEVVQHAGTLAEDIRLLMSARCLIASRGSFPYMIAHLSTHLHKAYFFEAMTYFYEPETLPILSTLGTQVVSVRDRDGEFRSKLLSKNWSNSSDQRALMLSYPPKKLIFDIADQDQHTHASASAPIG